MLQLSRFISVLGLLFFFFFLNPFRHSPFP